VANKNSNRTQKTGCSSRSDKRHLASLASARLLSCQIPSLLNLRGCNLRSRGVDMRVLMFAYACLRSVGSEPEAGFNYLHAAASRHEVTVVTHSVYADDLRRACHEGALPPVTIVAIDTPLVTRKAMGRVGVGHLDYFAWQLRARRRLRQRVGNFDVVHHVTFGADWMPSVALSFRGLPAVWGSVGGCAPFPWQLIRYLPAGSLAGEITRQLLTRLLRLWVRRQVVSSRCLVIAKNRETAAYFQRIGADVLVNPHVVVLPRPARDAADRLPSARRRAIFVSKLVAWKGPLLAIHTLAQLQPDWLLDFYGAGPIRERASRLAKRLGVDHRVTFHGRVPKAEVLSAMQAADVLLFPSMRDTSPMPVAEAGWAGCPVVCLDVAGPPILIRGTTGAAVPIGRHIARRMAEAVEATHRHPPVDRWNSAELAKSVDAWYRRAVNLATG
jgi:glycosyltransferase involved in cell wall biosynthesis